MSEDLWTTGSTTEAQFQSINNHLDVLHVNIKFLAAKVEKMEKKLKTLTMSEQS